MVDRLTVMIRDGHMVRGDKLPTEGALAQGHGVSRTVVREALSRLQAAGLVETHQGRGSFVLAKPKTGNFKVDAAGLRSLDDLLEMLDFRMGVETEAAALAAVRRTKTALAHIQEKLAEFETGQALPNSAVEADFNFHLSIAKASQNRHFQDLLTSLGPTMIAMPRSRLAADDEHAAVAQLGIVAAEHANIVLAIERQDPEAARAALRVHLSNSKARLRNSMQG